MKKIFIIMLVLTCIILASCANDTVKDPDTTGESNIADTTDENLTKELLVAGRSVVDYVIVLSDEPDQVAKDVSDYIVGKVKEITNKDMYVKDDTDAVSAYEIVIGNTSRFDAPDIGEDNFLIKVENGQVYIWYPDIDTAYNSVIGGLTVTLFAKESNVLAEGYELIGKCGNYTIGDNEFNPFE